MTAKKKTHAPYLPVEYEIHHAAAIQALVVGEATPHQQIEAIKWIIESVSAYYDLSYYPGEEGRRDSDFAEGRRFVGATLVKMSRLNLSEMRRKQDV